MTRVFSTALLVPAAADFDYFNNHSSLPTFLPADGGPGVLPPGIAPYPVNFNNDTIGGYGTNTGHTIYLIYQGLIHTSRLALSSLGTQSDVDLFTRHYQEDWWLAALLARDLSAIWHRTFYAHNYEVTALEAYLDMYVITGNATYRDAVMAAWQMLYDHWIHVGGSFAIDEYYYYPPDSYYLTYTKRNTNFNTTPPQGHTGEPGGHEACGGPTNVGRHDYHTAVSRFASHAQGLKGPSGDLLPPFPSEMKTGELCGSVFWAKLNQRLHYLDPDNETYVAEIERSIYNVGIAAQGNWSGNWSGAPSGGPGIRSFANLHMQKMDRKLGLGFWACQAVIPRHAIRLAGAASNHGTCCEGQGTRLFGSLAEHVFSLTEAGSVYIDLYTPSTMIWDVSVNQSSPATQTIEVDTSWPYGADVLVSVVRTTGPPGSLDIALRIPAWVEVPLSITVDGAELPTQVSYREAKSTH